MKGLNLYLINGMYWITASLYLPFIFHRKGWIPCRSGFCQHSFRLRL